MAEQNNSESSNEALSPQKPPRKRTFMLGGALLGIMAIEAIVVVIVVKQFAGGPSHAEGATVSSIEVAGQGKKIEDVELEVVKLRAQNERSQRQIMYDLDVFVSVSDADKEKVGDILRRRKAAVQDRLSRIVRAAEPERFSEPDLRTLRKQIQAELAQIVGNEEMIREVLIPSVVSSEN